MKPKQRSLTVTEESVFAALLFVVVAFLFVNSLSYPAASRLFPTLVMVPLMIGLALDAFLALRQPTEKGARRAAAGEIASAAAWVLMLLGLMLVAGLAGAMAIFPLIYMRLYCGESWRATLITAVTVGFLAYVFIVMIKVPNYPGLILGFLGY